MLYRISGYGLRRFSVIVQLLKYKLRDKFKDKREDPSSMARHSFPLNCGILTMHCVS